MPKLSVSFLIAYAYGKRAFWLRAGNRGHILRGHRGHGYWALRLIKRRRLGHARSFIVRQESSAWGGASIDLWLHLLERGLGAPLHLQQRLHQARKVMHAGLPTPIYRPVKVNRPVFWSTLKNVMLSLR